MQPKGSISKPSPDGWRRVSIELDMSPDDFAVLQRWTADVNRMNLMNGELNWSDLKALEALIVGALSREKAIQQTIQHRNQLVSKMNLTNDYPMPEWLRKLMDEHGDA